LIQQRFESFFQDALYLLYKNQLYNYLTRRRAIRQLWISSPGEERVLELGCGISPMLPGSGRTVRTDVSWQALAYLAKCSSPGKSSPAVVCDATQLPFAPSSFHQIICSEVLEHIEHDEEVMREMNRILSPGGQLILTVPARPELFGFDDSFVGHCRRYEKEKLIETLTRVGFGHFQVKTVLGQLEKWLMEPATRFFSKLRGGDQSMNMNRAETFLRMAAWCFFPIYVAFNWLLVACVGLQARWTRPEQAVTLLIRCRKQS